MAGTDAKFDLGDLQMRLNKFIREALANSDNDDYRKLHELVEQLARDISLHSGGMGDPPSIFVQQFVCLMKALSNSVTKIDVHRHVEVLRTIFHLSLWSLPGDAQNALMKLLIDLTIARKALQDTCIEYLVQSLCMPLKMVQPSAAQVEESSAFSPTEDALRTQTYAVETLNTLLVHDPLCARSVRPFLEKYLPHHGQPRINVCTYYRGILELAGMEGGRCLWDATFATAIKRMVEMDAEINWRKLVEHIPGEDDEDSSLSERLEMADTGIAEALFEAAGDMDDVALGEGETDCEDQQDCAQRVGATVDSQSGFEGKKQHDISASAGDEEVRKASVSMARKLDPILGMLFNHMRSCAKKDKNCLWRDCIDAFDTCIAGCMELRFTPYVLFYGAYLSGPDKAEEFASHVVSLVCNPSEEMGRRVTCAAYVGSFMARFTLLSLTHIVHCMEQLVNYATKYAASHASSRRNSSSAPVHHSFSTIRFKADVEQHSLFFATCQALMYVTCFHAESLKPLRRDSGEVLGSPSMRDRRSSARSDFRKLVQQRIVPLMSCSLEPMQACLPKIAEAFSNTLSRRGLANLSSHCQSRNKVGCVRQKVRCDTYFPFDPYLLPISKPGLELHLCYRSWVGGRAVATQGARAKQLELEERSGRVIADQAQENDEDSESGDETELDAAHEVTELDADHVLTDLDDDIELTELDATEVDGGGGSDTEVDDACTEGTSVDFSLGRRMQISAGSSPPAGVSPQEPFVNPFTGLAVPHMAAPKSKPTRPTVQPDAAMMTVSFSPAFGSPGPVQGFGGQNTS